MIIWEIFLEKDLEPDLRKRIKRYRKDVGTMQLRYDIRKIADDVQKCFTITKRASENTWDQCYDFIWMPAFLNAVLVVDPERGLSLHPSFLQIAWEMGVARKKDRAPNFSSF